MIGDEHEILRILVESAGIGDIGRIGQLDDSPGIDVDDEDPVFSSAF
jgi:hypothetical protein